MCGFSGQPQNYGDGLLSIGGEIAPLILQLLLALSSSAQKLNRNVNPLIFLWLVQNLAKTIVGWKFKLEILFL